MATASERNPQRRHPGRRTHLVSSFGSDAVTLGSLSLFLLLPSGAAASSKFWLPGVHLKG
jgi:hypothetical protein